jgi:hypothetical protein
VKQIEAVNGVWNGASLTIGALETALRHINDGCTNCAIAEIKEAIAHAQHVQVCANSIAKAMKRKPWTTTRGSADPFADESKPQPR